MCWDTESRWVVAAPLAQLLVLSALPAFLLGIALGRALGRLGISQVSSFMALMPLLIFAWYYFVGYLIDRWRHRRGRQPVSS